MVIGRHDRMHTHSLDRNSFYHHLSETTKTTDNPRTTICKVNKQIYERGVSLNHRSALNYPIKSVQTSKKKTFWAPKTRLYDQTHAHPIPPSLYEWFFFWRPTASTITPKTIVSHAKIKTLAPKKTYRAPKSRPLTKHIRCYLQVDMNGSFFEGSTLAPKTILRTLIYAVLRRHWRPFLFFFGRQTAKKVGYRLEWRVIRVR